MVAKLIFTASKCWSVFFPVGKAVAKFNNINLDDTLVKNILGTCGV